ncbi:MAG: hypothetical protein IPO25_14835 [Saprospiraceae bacterium]|nr:hypothetical protein [Saprospiraceae bacterium]
MGCYFYSASAAWRMDQESFIKNISWINALKSENFHGVTGMTGVLDPDVGLLIISITTIIFIGFNNAAEPGIIQNSLGNEDLEWESNTTLMWRLNLKFLKVDLWHNRTF